MATQITKAVVHPLPMDRTARRLIALGALLFFLGLLAGLVVPIVTNPRMGVSAHLEAVMNGMFLIAIGAVWSRLSLPPRLVPWTSGLLSFGTYANCFFVGLAAIFGASKTMPLAGAGYAALPWQENLVTVGLTAAALAMLAGCALLVWGFFRREDAIETGAV
jgi:(hydroxyamino)benzene mutase